MSSLSHTSQIIALRLAGADDADTLRRLAELDEAPELDGEVMLAVIDGEPAAAMSLSDGLWLLRLRVDHLVGSSRGRRMWRRRRVGRLRPRVA